MPWFAIVLYLHLLAVVAAFAFASYIHLGQEHLWTATTTTEASAALRLGARGAAKMPWVGLALFLTGAWLTQAAFSWTTPWIDLSILGLLALEAFGSLSGARRRRLAVMLRHAGPAPLSPAYLQAAHDPLFRAANYLLPLLTLAIMLIMVLKPPALPGIIILLLAVVAGLALGRRRTPRAPLNASAAPDRSTSAR